MSRRFTPAPFAACALAVFLLTAPARADDAADAKAAASGFFAAMEGGNVAEAKALSAGSDKQLALLDSLVPVVHAFKQLENAALKKWGEPGRKTLTETGPGGQSFNTQDEIKRSTVKIDKDAATILPPDPKPDEQKKQAIQLRKVDNRWKVEMGQVPAEVLDNPKTAADLKAMADVARTAAAEIEQGKFADAVAARQAIVERVEALRAKPQPKKDAPKK